jgi:hypothetical protein
MVESIDVMSLIVWCDLGILGRYICRLLIKETGEL